MLETEFAEDAELSEEGVLLAADAELSREMLLLATGEELSSDAVLLVNVEDGLEDIATMLEVTDDAMENETCEDSTDPVWLEVVPQEEESEDAEPSGDAGASVSFSMARQPKTIIWTRRPRKTVMAERRNMGDSRDNRLLLSIAHFGE